jgi:hypothetical protein
MIQQHHQPLKVVCVKVLVVDGGGWCWGFLDCFVIALMFFVAYVWQLDFLLWWCSMLGVFLVIFHLWGCWWFFKLALTDVNYGMSEVQLLEKLLEVVEKAKYLAFLFYFVSLMVN